MKLSITEKDKALLKGLYKMQILSAGQIKRLYYGNSTYGYARIRRLQQDKKLINSKPLIINRKKITQYYYLTEKGMKLINKLNKEQQALFRKSYSNKLEDKYQVKRILSVNEIYITIKQLERQYNTEIWEWEDRRETKSICGINRNDLIVGVLHNKKTKEKYGIYVPYNLSKIETQKIIARKVLTEIKNHSDISKNIVLCTEKSTLQVFKETLKPAKSMLMVMEHVKGIETIYNLLSDYDSTIIQIYSEIIGIKSNEIEKGVKLFAVHKTKGIYLTEYLTEDMVKLDLVKKYLNDNRENKKLYIVCRQEQIEKLKKIIIKKELDKKKIKFIPLKACKIYLKSVDIKKIYTDITNNSTKPTTEKSKSMSVSFTGNIRRFLNKLPKGSRSQFIERAITKTEEYKQYEKLLSIERRNR